MSKLTQLFTSDLDNIPNAALEELEKAATKGLPAKSGPSQWLNRFKSFATGAAGSMLPAGSKADDYFTFMRDNFGGIDAPKLGHNEMVANNMHFESAMTQQNMGIKLDKARVADLTTKYNEQKKLIDGMGTTLSEARTAATHAVPQMIDAVKNESLAIQNSLNALKGAAPKTLAEAQALITDAQHKSLVSEVTETGKKYLEVKIPNGNKTVRLGELTAAGATLETGAIQQVQREFNDIGVQLMQKQQGYLEAVNKGVGLMEVELANSKTQFDKLGKLLNKPEVYSAAAKTAPAAGTAVTEATEGLMKSKADPTKLAANLEGKNIKANTLGVVGEEAGFMDKIKANIFVEKNQLLENGVVSAVERGGVGKIFRGGTIAASVGAIALGVKGLLTGRTDENGQSVPSDSGDLMKNGALIVGGGVGVGLLALSGGKAKGAVAL